MHIGLRKLDYTCFLKLFNGLYNAYIIRFFQKSWQQRLKNALRTKESRDVHDRRAKSHYLGTSKYVRNRNWNGMHKDRQGSMSKGSTC